LEEDIKENNNNTKEVIINPFATLFDSKNPLNLLFVSDIGDVDEEIENVITEEINNDTEDKKNEIKEKR